MAMAMLGASASLSSQLCSVSGRTGQPQLQGQVLVTLKRNGTGGVCVRARQGRGSGGDPESKQLLDAFFLGKALAETVSERIGSLVGELLSEVGQRQAEQQRQIREFQNEVQERAKTSAMKAAQKALATENTVSRTAATTQTSTQTSTVTYDEEPLNGSTVTGSAVTESTTSATEGANGLPSLPYDDLPPLDPPSSRPTPPSEQGTPDY
ncbi:hypothetical protein M758_5G110100 [Ceratodon purpureus]|nr:hypothetical protein M758_5G110100 [Ceratodon purpureus]